MFLSTTSQTTAMVQTTKKSKNDFIGLDVPISLSLLMAEQLNGFSDIPANHQKYLAFMLWNYGGEPKNFNHGFSIHFWLLNEAFKREHFPRYNEQFKLFKPTKTYNQDKEYKLTPGAINLFSSYLRSEHKKEHAKLKQSTVTLQPKKETL